MVPAACAKLQTALLLLSATIPSLAAGCKQRCQATRATATSRIQLIFQADRSLQRDDGTLDG